MFDFAYSSKVLLFAVTGSFFCTVLYNTIDDLFEIFIFKNRIINFQEIFFKYLISISTIGVLLSIIFYAFALKENNPLQIIIFLTTILGLFAPILSKMLVFIYFLFFLKN